MTRQLNQRVVDAPTVREVFMKGYLWFFLVFLAPIGTVISAETPKKWTLTLDSPEVEDSVVAQTSLNSFKSNVCFKINHIWVVTNKSVPVLVMMSGGTWDRFQYDTTVTTDIHPEFGRAEVPIKGIPADKFVRKMQQVVAMVTRSGHYSLRLRVTFEFDPSVECDEYPQ